MDRGTGRGVGRAGTSRAAAGGSGWGTWGSQGWGERGRGRGKAAAWHRWLEHSTYTGGQGLRGRGTLMHLPY